ncbi:type II toxin-antitoxin system RelE/ParE family toxin [Sphingopyxis indica]|uniref:type II toxin-antitoxin system RelE/ParE family toxin n=1 Tax=Sphingopyxis indica TaxID=436663 RepID=UPI0029390519|nr:type II toxin-antitoxin system RelE/ParE family toxin [Sphingopyxis indica]WOF45548.1 type II toxin-antitoxin system RelE/ParE family toxin [Sphingopyxis indica]
MPIYKNRWFDKFARRERIADASLHEEIKRAESGLIDADLGGGLIKQRVAREGEGRSGGYRTIIVFRSKDRAIFVLGFAKNDRANISAGDLAILRAAAKITLSFTLDELEIEAENGNLIEVRNDDENL